MSQIDNVRYQLKLGRQLLTTKPRTTGATTYIEDYANLWASIKIILANIERAANANS